VLVGVVSDTHGLVRPEALAALEGVDAIVHAGDVGRPEVLDALAAIAPLTVVRGNNDHGPWAAALPDTAVLDAGGARLFVLHDAHELACDPRHDGYAGVVAGHSHRPSSVVRDGVLYLNPGSIGPRRFRLPVSLARVHVDRDGRLRSELVTLDV
jgi:putative phosphoesterase